jgi:adenylate kinase family enzyme
MENMIPIQELKDAKRILIIGDSGFGKTTFAERISKVLHISTFALDDIYWKKKYSEPREVKESVVMVKELCAKEQWIIEGNVLHLMKYGINRADFIFVLRFRTIFSQWYSLVRRHFSRVDESTTALLELLVYSTKRHFGIGNTKRKQEEVLLKEKEHIVYTFRTRKEIDTLLNRF